MVTSWFWLARVSASTATRVSWVAGSLPTGWARAEASSATRAIFMATAPRGYDSELRPQSQRLAGDVHNHEMQGRRSNRAVPTPGPCTRTGCECAGQRVRACVVGTARNSISSLVARQTIDVPQAARGKGPGSDIQGQQPAADRYPGSKKIAAGVSAGPRGSRCLRSSRYGPSVAAAGAAPALQPALVAGHRGHGQRTVRPGPQR